MSRERARSSGNTILRDRPRGSPEIFVRINGRQVPRRIRDAIGTRTPVDFSDGDALGRELWALWKSSSDESDEAALREAKSWGCLSTLAWIARKDMGLVARAAQYFVKRAEAERSHEIACLRRDLYKDGCSCGAGDWRGCAELDRAVELLREALKTDRLRPMGYFASGAVREIDHTHFLGFSGQPGLEQLRFANGLRSTEFPAAAVIAAFPKSPRSIGNDEIIKWIQACGYSNYKHALRAFKRQADYAAVKDVSFVDVWNLVHGNRGRGRPPNASIASAPSPEH